VKPWRRHGGGNLRLAGMIPYMAAADGSHSDKLPVLQVKSTAP
jgi:hypothetical protein